MIKAWSRLFWGDILEEKVAGEEAPPGSMWTREGGSGVVEKVGGAPGGQLGGRLGLMGAELLETWGRQV